MAQEAKGTLGCPGRQPDGRGQHRRAREGYFYRPLLSLAPEVCPVPWPVTQAVLVTKKAVGGWLTSDPFRGVMADPFIS